MLFSSSLAFSNKFSLSCLRSLMISFFAASTAVLLVMSIVLSYPLRASLSTSSMLAHLQLSLKPRSASSSFFVLGSQNLFFRSLYSAQGASLGSPLERFFKSAKIPSNSLRLFTHDLYFAPYLSAIDLTIFDTWPIRTLMVGPISNRLLLAMFSWMRFFGSL